MARNRTPNRPIGTCPCPYRNCTKVANVYKYRAQSDDPTKQRRAGKLYLKCEEHGTTQDQSWILEHATITHGEIPDPPKPADKPKPSDEPPKPTEEKDDGWGFF